MYGGVKIIILIKTRTDGLNGGVGSQKYARIMPSALDLGLPIPHKKKMDALECYDYDALYFILYRRVLRTTARSDYDQHRRIHRQTVTI